VDVDKLVSLGCFNNIRKVVFWRGHKLEVDETQFEWGTVYEVECETSDPESVRSELCEFLDKNGVGYKYNTATKFQNFIRRSLE
jgi:uncharacterized protein YjbK